MSHDVFISHASKDKAVADAVCHALEGQGLRCWMAPRNIAPGKNFATSIVNAIPQCRIFVLVLSSESNASNHVAREVALAVKAGLAIIPFRIEAVAPTGDLRFYLEPIQWLDALTPPLKRHLAVLAERVKLLVHTGPAAPVGTVAKPRRFPRARYAIAVVAVLLCTSVAVVMYSHSQTSIEKRGGTVPPGTRLTPETLEPFLERVGLAPRAGTDVVPCFIDVRVNGTPFPVAVTLSKSQDLVWVFAQSPPMDPTKLSGEFALQLLRTNHASGPAYFVYSQDGKRLGLRLGLTNGGVTPTYFRSQLDVFARMLNQTSAIWVPEK